MRIYTVHRRQDAGQPDFVLVKEGFCWPAFVVALPWALWHRMWLTVLWLAAAFVLTGALGAVLGLDGLGGTVLFLGLAVLAGIFGNDLRRGSLARRGYAEEGVVAADNEDAAFRRFLTEAPLYAGGLRP